MGSRVKSVVFMFEAHQPFRLKVSMLAEAFREALMRGRTKRLSDILIDSEGNREIFQRVATKCYIPAMKILVERCKRLREGGKEFKFSLSLSGTLIEQAMRWNKGVLELVAEAVSEGFVEIVCQTYYHSLASLFSLDREFVEQVTMHKDAMKRLFGVEPVTAENTEFIYNNDIARAFEKLGFKVLLTEGVECVLGPQGPNHVYKAWGSDLRVLTRNCRLSDDVAFRFSDRSWDQYPLTASKYSEWIAMSPGDLIFVAVDLETFGEHHDISTGIHDFLMWLPNELAKFDNIVVERPSEAAYRHKPVGLLDVPPWRTISWADYKDLSAWLGNDMQRSAFELYSFMEPYVKALGGEYLELWRLLGSSDHLYYMATVRGPAQEVHTYFSPYKDVLLAYRTYVEALLAIFSRALLEVATNPRPYAQRIVLPAHLAFQFCTPPGIPTGHAARSLKELAALLDVVPPESIVYHVIRGDIAIWIRNYFFLDDVADEVGELSESLKESAPPVDVERLRASLKKILLRLLS